MCGRLSGQDNSGHGEGAAFPVSGARVQCHRSAFYLSACCHPPQPPSLFTLSPHFWMPPLCSELRINSNLGQGDGEGAPMSSWRLESVRKSRRLGDTDSLDFQTLILQLPLHLEELWKVKLVEHLHRMQTKDLPSTVPHFSG